ncbi:hypothetical protein M406DRAFT_327505 [Cryphonectria parasitica EP155]|uniref:GRF-type domain-containing protein n=1 Tax=Cryphonectria parasitica (strain ATCC 38755 / EP155) TaxID=660469 RepID=A0A9P5CS00_CRYP1|nr:uncharacterized protein M406DRAFT_327505 [Cryphonectria parasitica EP155]KAF3769099.1 hypothetical protein M406DRAFT_327505 [Cryphonectria parasitica EP155]
MYKTPSKSRSSHKAPFTPKKRGLFEDGLWLCDCSPRKPALNLKVKKEGPNKGKSFYTCDERKCGFFLFQHDAEPREREALLKNNCRSENGIVARVQAKGEPPVTPSFGRGNKTTMTPATVRPQQRTFRGLPHAGAGAAAQRRWSLSQDSEYLSYDSAEGEEAEENHNAGAVRPSAGASTHAQNGSAASSGTLGKSSVPKGSSSSGTTLAPPQTPSAKRKHHVFLEDSDDEYGGDELDDPDTSRQLARIADESARKRQQQQWESLATPTAQRTVQRAGGIPTPITRHSLLIAGEDRRAEDEERTVKRLRVRDSTPSKDGGDALDQASSVIGDAATPTPHRNINVLLFPPTASNPSNPAAATPAATRTLTASSAVPASPSPFKTPAATDHPRIADEVMSLLSTQPISEATRRHVRAALERHELRTKGLVKGRDAARAALEARDVRVAELQAQVVGLENARRMDKESLKELSRGLVMLSQTGDSA